MMLPFFQQHSLLQETPVLEACKNGEPCDKLYTDHHLLKSFGIKLMPKWTALVWSKWIWRSDLYCSSSSLQELGICWSISVHALISGESSFAHVQTWLMMGKTFMVLRDQLPPALHFFTFFNQQMMTCCGTAAEKVLLHHTEGFYTSVVDCFVQNGTYLPGLRPWDERKTTPMKTIIGFLSFHSWLDEKSC